MLLRNKRPLLRFRQQLRRSQTDAERKLWGVLRNKQFHGYKFFRQYSVGKYILDFYSPTLELCIELDGGQHAEARQMEHDRIRSEYLQSLGIRVKRFWDNDVLTNLEGVYWFLENWLEEQLPLQPRSERRGQTHPSPLFEKERE